ncbi:MAG: group III truncated hemoglobin [Flavobacteriales bacterium]|nr:group III truncated hemoglobin [Flavobacteriales bacterium]
MVNSFYNRIRQDDLLGNIFNAVIKDNWPIHLEKMYRFWQTVLLSEHTYNGSPFAPHAKMPIEKEHFERWKMLFFKTVDQYFFGKKAEEAKWRAEKMAEMFLLKIEYFKKSETKTIH